MKALLGLADMKGSYLYEIAPDIMPYGYASNLEIELWGLYYADKKTRQDNARKRA